MTWREEGSVATAASSASWTASWTTAPSKPTAQARTTDVDFALSSSSVAHPQTARIDGPKCDFLKTTTSTGGHDPGDLRDVHNPATHLQHESGDAGFIHRDPTDGHERVSLLGGNCQASTAVAMDSVFSDEKAWDHLREGTSETWAPVSDFKEITESDSGWCEESWEFGSLLDEASVQHPVFNALGFHPTARRGA